MGKAFRYSTITGSLNQIGDRFMRCGYKRDYSYQEILSELKKLGVLDGVELSYSTEGGVESDEKQLLPLLSRFGFQPTFVNSSLFGEQKWMFGSLSSPDAAVRERAISDTRHGLDFARSIRAAGYNLWTGQDGFDYPFQTDYRRQFDLFVDSVRKLCDHAPDLRIALEPKPREPRNRSLIDTVPTALLACSEVGRKNVGLTIDVGHTLAAGGNMARDLDMALRSERLFNVHVNDNYGTWDDDMIVGSVHLIEWLEVFWVLKKRAYDGWISVDIFPYRENQFEAVRESILYMERFAALVDRIGVPRLDALVERGSVTEMLKLVREQIFAG
ncbi:MAG TPA: sugar phosphate isomerase/epimerase family protein [Anaeromyxobacter sp.]|nr:sugar phosphate isomerase/epimerase family protein [Anaeromyxobacter sp.]